MIEFQKRKRLKKIIYSPIILIILIIILFFIIKGTWNVYKKDRLSKLSLDREKIELQKIIDRENNLNNSIEYLKTEKGIESEIRSKFRAVKNGEKIAVIIDEESSTTIPIQISDAESKNIFYKIIDWFML